MVGYKLLTLKTVRGVELVSDVARRALVSDNTIRQLENGGTCRPHEAIRLAAALGTDLDGLGALAMTD